MKLAMPEESEVGTRDPELVMAVVSELRTLRSERGKIVPELLVNYPALYGLASQTNARDAWVWLREISKAGSSSKYVEAARLTVFSESLDVLNRLTEAGEILDRDQRTIREWSNRGMVPLAQLLVDASYMSGARAMHFVSIDFVKAGEIDGSPVVAMRIYWAGHESLRGECVSVYGVNDAQDQVDKEYSELGGPLAELTPEWRNIDIPRGAFSIEAGIQLQLPIPLPPTLKLLTLKFGKQSTQLVRVDNLPLVGGKRMAVSVFRQGVSFWFDDNKPHREEFTWEVPRDIFSR
ncbi:hypothetical protein AYK61_15390 [Rhodococcus sp. SBT000017]|uniref:hypothetical protein n=1 Tax=Rhodococcus sp. SBT000017 TaxID=1803385 RepID=UPI000EF860D2|nr:hypothetical protein [Rhodococcus sp. SBT000017]RMB77649.1 hypothetical protein AYK61_15390 [Rhodococcus sp. SBT000017]